MTRKTRPSYHQLRIGVDTGGTFTDFIVVFKKRQLSFKVPSTPYSPPQALLTVIDQALTQINNAFEALVDA
ncbi:MAG: hypothetical protein KA368_06195, partial [Acidobacteria bacterium]|nr:hypothetical protein [Acidobacteriota bacterium]